MSLDVQAMWNIDCRQRSDPGRIDAVSLLSTTERQPKSHDLQASHERRTGALDRRMRDRMPESDRRIESVGPMVGEPSRAVDPATATLDPQRLFERS